MQTPRHLVITPAHNEEGYLDALIASMRRQSIPPTEWVIVDDRSSDRTPEILATAAAQTPWIHPHRHEGSDTRAVGSKVARLVLWGLEQASEPWEFISKIDADLTLPDDYFEKLFARFDDDPQLGIGGGACYVRHDERLELEWVAADHTRGALKTYRRPCWEAMGGIRPVNGWDGVDTILAQMHGWQTRHFEELRVEHHRPTGSFDGALRGKFTAGRFAHFLGYHPLFMAARCTRRMLDSPRLFGGAAMWAGFLYDRVRGVPMLDEPGAVEFLRKKQMDQLGKVLTEWGPRRGSDHD